MNILSKYGGNLDAFARLRVSEPTTIFDSKQLVDTQPLIWDDVQISGAGTASTYNTNQASTTLSTTNATAGRRVRQTFRRFNYQPGKSQLIVMTGILGASTATEKRMGIFDDNNGLFFSSGAAGRGVNIRTKTSGTPVDTTVLQSAWNIDKFDGTGQSRLTLDFSKTQIFFIDFEWLGVGTVRFGFFVNGIPYYAHASHNANVLTTVYMSTPNLPLRYEIISTGGAADSITHICATVTTEGGRQQTGYPRGLPRIAPMATNNNASFYPLIAIRLKSTHLGATLQLKNLSVTCTSSSAYAWQLMLNPTVTGTALSFVGVANSVAEADITSTNATTVSGGTILEADTNIQASEGAGAVVLMNDFALGSTIAGVSDILVLAVSRITGAAETFYGSINWREEI